MKKTSFTIEEFQPGEIQFVFSRSSGPGGQNVNKVNTKATVIFHLAETARFNEEEKNRIRHALRTYLDKNGCLQVHCQEYRSQWANRNAALERLDKLLHMALRPRKIRKQTKIPRGAAEKRLKNKKQRAEIKRLRSRPQPGE